MFVEFRMCKNHPSLEVLVVSSAWLQGSIARRSRTTDIQNIPVTVWLTEEWIDWFDWFVWLIGWLNDRWIDGYQSERLNLRWIICKGSKVAPQSTSSVLYCVTGWLTDWLFDASFGTLFDSFSLWISSSRPTISKADDLSVVWLHSEIPVHVCFSGTKVQSDGINTYRYTCTAAIPYWDRAEFLRNHQ